MPEVKVGDEVLYVPDSCHQLTKDRLGNYVFEFVHEQNAPNSAHSYQKGDVVQNHGELGLLQSREGGVLQTMGGHRIRPTRPLYSWKAVVREVFADGTVALDVQHPRGYVTYHYPSHGATSGLRYSPTLDPHTWHLPADEAKASA